MKALVYHGPKVFGIEEKPLPSIGEKELLIKVLSVGICPTDVRIMHYGSSVMKPPVIMGHEVAGIVEEVGEGIEKFAKGDVVALPADAPCMGCETCRRGFHNMCENLLSIGYNVDGGYAEYMRVPRRFVEYGLVFKLPKDVDHASVALAEPVAAVLEGLKWSRVGLGKSIAIIGDGPNALIALQISRVAGAKPIIVSGITPERLEIAKKLGADYVINAREEPAKEKILKLTGGVDIAFVSVGLPETIKLGLEVARKGGMVHIFGGAKKGTTVEIDPNILHYNQIIFTGATGYTPRTYEEALCLILNGIVKIRPLISHELPLEKILDGIALVKEWKGLKVVVHP